MSSTAVFQARRFRFISERQNFETIYAVVWQNV